MVNNSVACPLGKLPCEGVRIIGWTCGEILDRAAAGERMLDAHLDEPGQPECHVEQLQGPARPIRVQIGDRAQEPGDGIDLHQDLICAVGAEIGECVNEIELRLEGGFTRPDQSDERTSRWRSVLCWAR